MRASRGSVLILSVWAVSLLASVTVAQAIQVGLQARLVGRDAERAQAAALARTAVAHALWQLGADSQRDWDARSEAWAQPETWTPPFSETEDAWRVTIADADGPLNLNEATPEMLARVPALASFVAAIVAQRAGQPFRHLEELVTRVGVARSALPGLRPLLRTQGPKGVSLHGTTPEVLVLLGLSPELADRLCRLRDGGPGVADDLVFPRPEEIQPILARRLGLTPQESAVMTTLVAEGWLGVASSRFAIEAVGIHRRHGQHRTVAAIVARDGSHLTVEGWHEV